MTKLTLIYLQNTQGQYKILKFRLHAIADLLALGTYTGGWQSNIATYNLKNLTRP